MISCLIPPDTNAAYVTHIYCCYARMRNKTVRVKGQSLSC